MKFIAIKPFVSERKPLIFVALLAAMILVFSGFFPASGSAAKFSTTSLPPDSFSSLGLSPDMVGKYTDIVLDFVQSEAGQQTMTVLKNALI